MKFSGSGPLPCVHLVESFEKEISIKIPEPYRSFICETNGGYPENKAFDALDGSGFVLQRLFPIGCEPPFELANQNRYEEHRNRLLHIGMSICGDHVVIPLRGRKRGTVAWIDHEIPEPLIGLPKLIPIAHNFGDLLEGLYPL